jgi:hypothetical protein
MDEQKILQTINRKIIAAKKLRQRYDRLHAQLEQVNAEMDTLQESLIFPVPPEFTEEEMYEHLALFWAARMALCRHQPGQEHFNPRKPYCGCGDT